MIRKRMASPFQFRLIAIWWQKSTNLQPVILQVHLFLFLHWCQWWIAFYANVWFYPFSVFVCRINKNASSRTSETSSSFSRHCCCWWTVQGDLPGWLQGQICCPFLLSTWLVSYYLNLYVNSFISVLIFFFSFYSTFVCPTEIVAFSERADEFRKINCELIACSTDSHFCHLAWVNTPRKQGGLGSLNMQQLLDSNSFNHKMFCGNFSKNGDVFLSASQGIFFKSMLF